MSTAQPTLDDVWRLFQETDRKFQDTDRKFQDTDRKFQDTDRKFLGDGSEVSGDGAVAERTAPKRRGVISKPCPRTWETSATGWVNLSSTW
jgi:hypothetical protein